MFSARAVSRALRTPSARLLTRSAVRNPRPAILAAAWKPAVVAPLSTRLFSTALRAFEKQGTVDEELVVKLSSELEMEKEMHEYDQYPANIQEYLNSSPFKVNDKPGQEEVELVRKFGDETIKVVFSISDLNAMTDENGVEDDALYDENPPRDNEGRGAMQSGGAQSKAAQNQGRVPVANEAAEEEDEFSEDADANEDAAFPARLNITIEKPNQGALQVEAMAQDGMVVIDNVFYHKSAALATAQTAEADWERRGVYAGPPFGNLDEDLQVLIERYLEERGINTALALFVPDYIDYKEQKEYLSWLENVKGFIEA